jgi:hypothetical protein
MCKTRFQTCLLFAELSQCQSSEPMQDVQILRDVVAQPAIFRSCPDLLDWIKFRSIGRKPLDTEASRKAFSQSAYCRTMNAPAIQNPDDSAREMTHNFNGKTLKILMANVAEIHPEKQGQSLPVRRDAKHRNHRQPVPSVPRIQNRRLTSGTPGSTNQRLQQQTGFVGHQDVSTAFSGFFLFWASPAYATFRLPPRRVLWHVPAASDNSSRGFAGYAKQRRGHSQSQNSPELPCQYAPVSIIPWQTRNCGGFATATSADVFSVWRSTPQAVRCWGWHKDHLCLAAYTWLSIARQLQTLHQNVWLLHWFRILVPTVRLPDAVAVPAFFDYQKVSFPHFRQKQRNLFNFSKSNKNPH